MERCTMNVSFETDRPLSELIIALLGLLIALFLLPIVIVIRGWVFLKLWIWFVVPLGIPTISLAHACGIGLIAAYLCKQYSADSVEKTDAERKRAAAVGFAVPLVTLAIGWVIQRFM
jgi:hypothetical protein